MINPVNHTGSPAEVDRLCFDPCIPADWDDFRLHYRYRETVYHILVTQMSAENREISVSVDGAEQQDRTISIGNDHNEHWAEIKIQQPAKK